MCDDSQCMRLSLAELQSTTLIPHKDGVPVRRSAAGAVKG